MLFHWKRHSSLQPTFQEKVTSIQAYNLSHCVFAYRKINNSTILVTMSKLKGIMLSHEVLSKSSLESVEIVVVALLLIM